jgi:hypothetical protein
MVLVLLFQREERSFSGMLIRRDYTHSIVVKQADRKKTALLKKGKSKQAAEM